jgi:cysteine-S-conjugate beta-lyase
VAGNSTVSAVGQPGRADGPPRSVFDEAVDRRRSNSMKWARATDLLAADEAAADPLPMWVADTDFKAPQAVIEALHDAVDHGIFGYPGGATDGYLDAVTGWQARRFGWEVPREWCCRPPASSPRSNSRCRRSRRRATRW